MELEKIDKKNGGIVPWIFVMLAIGGYIYQMGVTSSSLGENTRRIQSLEVRADSAMTKDDAVDLKKRLERIEDKVDHITVRQARGN